MNKIFINPELFQSPIHAQFFSDKEFHAQPATELKSGVIVLLLLRSLLFHRTVHTKVVVVTQYLAQITSTTIMLD
jgi:hypothetical protein